MKNTTIKNVAKKFIKDANRVTKESIITIGAIDTNAYNLIYTEILNQLDNDLIFETKEWFINVVRDIGFKNKQNVNVCLRIINAEKMS